MEKNVLIIQKNTDSLSKVNESSNGNGIDSRYVLGGPFTEFDVMNRNERIYNAEKFLPCLEELNERMTSLGVVYGELDHPDSFDTSLKDASHALKDVGFNKEKNIVEGKIQLLSGTEYGKSARSIVDDGFPLFVSSRAAGVTESNGSVSLKKLFTYDIVADPGFASARVSSINESCGYTNNSNFRVYPIDDESKINELFNMNQNDLVTKKQLSEYSQYLVGEIGTTKKKVNEAVKKGEMNPKKVQELLAYYEGLQSDNDKLVKYLDYLAEKIQYVVSENETLKGSQNKTNEKLSKSIAYSGYLAENLDKNIDYSEYIAENVDKNIDYSEYIAENVDKNIDYSEYIAENLDKNINYSEYIAENVDKNINYSEYIAENLDKNIDYSEYIAENLDKNIDYSEYIAENLSDNINYSEYIAENLSDNINYSEYIAENVEGNIAYSEYIAENLDDNIGYSDYIAEGLDKSISYTKMVSEKLNTNGKINETLDEDEEDEFPMPEDAGFEDIEDEEVIDGEETETSIDGDSEKGCKVVCDTDENDETDESEEEEDVEDFGNVTAEEEEELTANESKQNKKSNLSTQIDNLITEAKKRKASETNEHHFLKFLNKAQVDSFYALSKDEQETVITHINEKGDYFTSGDVLKLMKDALSTKEETLDERIIRLMPDNIKPIWEKMENKAKMSILSQARLHPELKTEETISHFWATRNMKKKSVNKELVEKDNLIQEDKLSKDAMNGIMERFESFK